jgi:hypothetical protein
VLSSHESGSTGHARVSNGFGVRWSHICVQ